MRPLQWLSRTDLRGFRRSVTTWYAAHGRSLPWRSVRDPYPIWVSEVMLQQTQVATVERYYPAFLERFPMIESLAAANEEALLRVWQGLGYYRRAQNMHKAARRIVEEFDGRFPDQLDQLRSLPGLGRYTAGAIASFAFRQRTPVLEANTIRLWTRLCGADGDPTRQPLNGELWRLAEETLPTRNCGDFNQALMDLGATVCTDRAPACARCPLRRHCTAFAEGSVDRLPTKRTKASAVAVDAVTVVLRAGRQVVVRRRPSQGRWANLWEFPHAERRPGESWEGAAKRAVRAVTPVEFQLLAERMTFRHSIMHYRVYLKCFDAVGVAGALGGRRRAVTGADCRWLRACELSSLPFSSPQRRIARSVSERFPGPSPER